MPRIMIRVGEEWVEIPTVQGPPGELTVSTANALYAPYVHDHNSIYYTKAEVDAVVSGAVAPHDHNDLYYTMSQIDSQNLALQNLIGNVQVTVDDQWTATQALVANKADIIHNQTASTITSGTFDAARIPSLDAAKITTGTINLARIPVLDTARVPSLDASKITSGTMAAARIPNLDAAKISTGTFSASRIPSLNTSQITAGTFSISRIPTGTTASTVALGSHRHTRHNLWEFTWRKTAGSTESMRNNPGYDQYVVGSVVVGRDVIVLNTNSVSSGGVAWNYCYVDTQGFGWVPWLGFTQL